MESSTTEHESHNTTDLWSQVETILAVKCETHDDIDSTLRSYLSLLEAYREESELSDDDIGHCASLLYSSPLFAQHDVYIRHQLIYCLLQEDNVDILRIAVRFLLADALRVENTFDLLNREAAFPRLVDLIAHPQKFEGSIHRTLMELMYEMARVQRISNEDLLSISDEFICSLFDLIEQASDDVNDPYHYPVIRVLLVLNEQFMVAAYDPDVLTTKVTPLTNKVIKVLSAYESRYKTFGANIILLLNREDETSLQLLTLKLMYLLFTTPPTFEYFYTNDLRVLVDILLRNLLDLPDDAEALRHTYLRVLYPLLKNTQLQRPPYYKKSDIWKLLSLLCGNYSEHAGTARERNAALNHFEAVDDTTKRLVARCQTVEWLSDLKPLDSARVGSPIDDRPSPLPDSPVKSQPPDLPSPRKLRKRGSSKSSAVTNGQFLTPQLETARHSSLSMLEMATHKEKPGVITPSRNPSAKHSLIQSVFAKKEKPPLPKARRSGLMRPKVQTGTTEMEVATLEAPQIPTTTSPEEHRTERFEDAKEFPFQIEPKGTDEDAVVGQNPELSQSSIDEAAKTAKNPPPIPKIRRGWRTRKSKDNSDEGKEPGRFSSRMPSLDIKSAANAGPLSSPEDHGVPENSPFSPIQDKTLDPLNKSGLMSHDIPTATPEKRSVRTAVNDAQEIAIQEVERCLENTQISSSPDLPLEETNTSPSQFSPNPSVTINGEALPVQRTILAPPGQAPIRAVPGPRLEVEKSPFLSDDELSQEPDSAEPSRKPSGTDEAEVVGLGLSRKDSWEDFGD